MTTTKPTVPAKLLAHSEIRSTRISASYEIARDVWMALETGALSVGGMTVELKLGGVEKFAAELAA